MAANQLSLAFESLLGFLKAASDETRLKLICILSEREYNVGELAELLELKAPTVSHHLAKLHENGLGESTPAVHARNGRPGQLAALHPGAGAL